MTISPEAEPVARMAIDNTLGRMQEETIAAYERIIREHFLDPKRRGALTEGELCRHAAAELYYYIQKHPQPGMWAERVGRVK